jgi:hypothetical protein
METYVAIDNVCAWPNLTMLPNGDIAAIIFNQPSHATVEGEVECWISSDEGVFWRKQGVPISHTPGAIRMNHAAGLAGNGDLIVLCAGWTSAVAPRTIAEPAVCRSSDGGSTWTQSWAIEKPEGVTRFTPFGDIVRSGNGVLGASFYSSEGPRNYFLRSYDDGISWVEPVVIGRDQAGNAGQCVETALLCLGGQRVMAAVRTKDKRNLDLYVSDNFGETWSFKEMLTLGNQHPAHMLLLQDGRILLTYGIRNQGYYGIGARISGNSGESWGHPIFLHNFQIATDGGYPSSVQSADGTIITAYYSNKVPHHHRYHMGVIRWNMSEIEPK